MIKKKYFWKEISGDGLIKNPKAFGPYYSTESLNCFCGFDNEKDAEDKLIKINKIYPHEIPSSLILVAEYSVIDDT